MQGLAILHDGTADSIQTNKPDSSVSALYQGSMDMTYFAISSPLLKQHDLKIAIVFNYEDFRFEAWLAGKNRNVNRKYWELLKRCQWPEYRIVTPLKGVDSIVECELAEGLDPSDTNALTACIETGACAFIKDIERILSQVKAT